MHKLSVVLITRNEAQKIVRGIESVLKAITDIPDTEVVLVDSASTDTTVDIAKQYPITVVQLPADAFLSPSAGRYMGFQYSDGQYIYFLDGDMWLDENWFHKALPMMEANKQLAALAGRCHEVCFNESGDIVSEDPDRFQVGEKKHAVRHLGQSVLYRRDVLTEVGGFNPYLSNEEELELGLRISAAGYELQRIPEPMTIHHTQFYSQENPSGITWRQIQRDCKLGRYIALGQVLRLLQGNPFIGEYTGLYKRELLFSGIYFLGAVALVLGVLMHKPLYFALWLIAMLCVFVLRAVIKRNINDTGLYFFDYLLCAYGFMVGFWKAVPPASNYQVKPEVYKV
ncbi:glycosyltransferase family A protein [Candidatus Venteria ishoeyi]|uniref:glycosyltransferase n=1 Tax=Candidatus Venteria ishoeyi TaxID=1899563 RepID=UPI0025A5F108|nr:glycosyltransferase family A protein [Candidatus Venteria ishoeyi]MDM8548193.1 glycosyltransferase family A protein [Candidatus Venteria ishoeyi]